MATDAIPGAAQRSAWWSYLLVALLSLGAAEIALRLYNHVQPSFVFYNSSYSRYRGNPGESWFGFRLNSHGFMDTEFAPKQPGTYRIVAIGDSFAHGVVPYPDNVLTLTESVLQETRPDVELYNMGIPRIGPREYVSLLANEGLAYDPDLVLVTFYVGNDLHDAASDHEKRRPYQYSFVLSLLRHVFYTAPRSPGVGLPLARDRYVDDAKSIDDERYSKAKRQTAELFLASPDELRQLVQTSMRYLAEMQRMADARHARFVVAVFPDELQLYEPLRKNLLGAALRNDGAPIDMALPSELLDEALEAALIPHLDLRPAMLDAARITALYKPNDTHWNIAGNALAARELAAFLKRAL